MAREKTQKMGLPEPGINCSVTERLERGQAPWSASEEKQKKSTLVLFGTLGAKSNVPSKYFGALIALTRVSAVAERGIAKGNR